MTGSIQPLSKASIASTTAVAVIVVALAGYALWRSGASPTSFPVAASPIALAQKPAPTSTAHPLERKTIPLTPDQFIEPAQAGRLAYSGGDYVKAIELYESAVAQRPQDAESWSNLGQVLVRLERVEEALDKFARAIELNPDRWTYHFNLARAQGLLGNWQAAVEQYRAAQRLFPDDYASAFNLGLALRKAGDDGGAVEAFKRAIELDPEDPTFHFSLAGAYEQLGQVADAISEYQRTLELAESAPEAPAIRARILKLKEEPPKPAAAPAETPANVPAQAVESGR